jgi:O-antigen ligase/tetratricopeptide (TPR) repeat protein
MTTKAKSKSLQRKSYEKKIKTFQVILLIAVMIVIFYPPYLRGLFFEEDQLPSEIFVFLVFAAFWVFKALKKDRKFLVTPIDYASLGFAVVYFLSLFASVHMRLAIVEWLKYCMYFAVFFIVTELAEEYKFRIGILWVIVVSGTGVAFLGLDAAAGGHVVGALNQLFKVLGASQDVFFELFKDNRIYSVLQYPNALAAYLMGIFFVTLGLIMSSKRLWVRAIAGGIGFMLLVTFAFTISRGAYLVMGVALVIYIIVLPKGSRIRGVAYAAALIITTGIISIFYADYISNPVGNEHKMWLAIAAGVFLSAGLVTLIQYIVKYLEMVNWKVYAGIAAVLIVGGAALAIYLYNVPAPLELSHAEGEADSLKVVTRSVVLQPGSKYALEYEVDSSVEGDKPYAYSVEIYSRNLEHILAREQGVKLADYSGKEDGIVKPEDLEFSVPGESRVIDIVFSNLYEGTSVKLNNARLIDTETGALQEKLVLKRKYIPDSMSSRLDNLATDTNTIERLIFYKDGLKMMMDRWLLGAGGGAWSLIYFSYQSYMYWSSQAHNFPLQLGIETGLVGIFVLIFLLVSILTLFITNRKNKKRNGEGNSTDAIMQSVLLTGIAAVFMHSVLDFDLTYPAIFLLLWQLIALLNSCFRQEILSNGMDVKNIRFLRWINKVNLNPVFGVVIALAVTILPVMFISGQAYANKAMEAYNAQNNGEALKYAAKAASADPFKPEYRVDYANLLIRKENRTQQDINEAEKAINRALVLGQNDVKQLANISLYYFNTGRIEKALELIDITTQKRPFREEEWQQRVNAYFSAAMSYFTNIENDKGLEYTDKTLALIEEAKSVNEKNLVPFIFNAQTMDMLEKLKYIKDMHKIKQSINIDTVVFYGISNMDIDSDGIPDQWKPSGEGHVEFGMEDSGVLTIENTGVVEVPYIESRELQLQPGNEYTLQVKLANNIGVHGIPYTITNLTAQPENMVLKEGAYTAEFKIPEEHTANNSTLRLYVTDKYVIEGIEIIRK